MNLIVAVDSNWGIGRQDRLLFRISEDMKHFRALTLGKTVVLGRRTLQTFPGGRPLEKRTNIVMTRSASFRAEPALVCHSLEELQSCLQGRNDDDVFVIGGASVYRQLLPFCRLAYVTKIHRGAEADCHFADLDSHPGWEMMSREDFHTSDGQITDVAAPASLDYSFCIYRQANPLDLSHEAK